MSVARQPQDDLISALAQVVDDGERLTEDELIGTCVLLLNAGHEATVNVTGNGWWSLFRNPDQLARLRDDAALVPRAIEELMRWDTPLQMFERWVLEDSEVCGVAVPKGAELGLLFGSANRDPDVFDRPDDLDVGREPEPARLVRRRRPLLPGRAARAPGARRRRSPRSCAGCPALQLVEEPALEAELHHPGTARAPRRGVTRSRSVDWSVEPAVGFEPTT